jgi:hypothetical protein
LDPDLVSGLLSALNNFSEVELKSRGIESINMGGLQWCYLSDLKLNLLLIAADSKSSNSELMRARLDVIKNMFVTQYNITPESWNNLVNIQQFQTFSSIVDMLRMQWEQAEKNMGVAALFDLLGVFQQIFNLFVSIIRSNFFGAKYELINKEMTQFNTLLETNPELQSSPELKNITYDDQSGFNVITLNPMALDELTLKRALVLITEYARNMIIKHLGYMVGFSSFSKEILPYILSNWDLLERLNITKTLLDIFFSRLTR